VLPKDSLHFGGSIIPKMRLKVKTMGCKLKLCDPARRAKLGESFPGEPRWVNSAFCPMDASICKPKIKTAKENLS
jgi:hypothetical protein